jgi:hypothetical protein
VDTHLHGCRNSAVRPVGNPLVVNVAVTVDPFELVRAGHSVA